MNSPSNEDTSGAEQKKQDEDLIRVLKKGKAEALALLWEKLCTWGIHVARKYKQDEEVGRNAALNAYKRITKRGIHQFRYKCSFWGYCRHILINEVKRLIKPSPPLPPFKAPLPLLPLDLRDCLDRLEPLERLVIELFYFMGMSADEIGAPIGIEPGYVHQILSRTRRKLRTCLHEKGHETSASVLEEGEQYGLDPVEQSKGDQ